MNPFATLERFRNATAVIDASGREHSYADLIAMADASVVGIGASRNLVAIECRNDLPTLAAYLGCLRSGHVPVLVDATLANTLKQQLYERFRPNQVHTSDGWGQGAGTLHELHPDLSLLLSTSGSTGSPKLVRLSSRNIASNAEAICDYLAIDQQERAITTLPLHYSYGLSVVNSHLLAGASLILTDESVVSASFWQLATRHAATSMAGVPATYRMLRRLRFERMDLPALKTLTQAGGRLAPDEIRWFLEVCGSSDKRFIVMYGQTEATARISWVPHDHAVAKCGSIGIPIPGGSLHLVDEDGNTVTQTDVTGELVYQGENVMLGYAQSPDDLAGGASVDQLHTGDLAMRDKDGYFWITGRLNRYVKIHGARYSLDEIENFVRTSGISVTVAGEEDFILVAVCGDHVDTAAIKESLKCQFGLRTPTVEVALVDVIPTSASGKTQYADLLFRYKASAA